MIYTRFIINQLCIALAVASMTASIAAIAAESSSIDLNAAQVSSCNALNDIPSVEQAKSVLDFGLKAAANYGPSMPYSYETSIEQARRHNLPAFYVLSMQSDLLTRLFDERRAVNSPDELLFDFHLAIMTRSAQSMSWVSGQLSRFSLRGIDAEHRLESAGSYPPFLAPMPELSRFVNVYLSLYSGAPPASIGPKFENLEEWVGKWQQAAQISSLVESNPTVPSSPQVTTAWMYFHLGLLARQVNSRVPSKRPEAYFREAARYISPSCPVLFAEALKRLATNRNVCTDVTEKTSPGRDPGALDRSKYPYFCFLADIGALSGK